MSLKKIRWLTLTRHPCRFLNRHFQYDNHNYNHNLEIMQGLVKLIGKKYTYSKPTLKMDDVRHFSVNLENFGLSMPLIMLKKMQHGMFYHISNI